MSTSAPGATPERFGRYVLLDQIGRGGMAEVYRAVAQGLEGFQRVFVIKRILREKSLAPEFVEMFINEARISALLNHPNIVQIYDFGQIEGSYFLAMEHLRGKDLLTVLRGLRGQGRQMKPEIAAYMAQQVALGLQYAHNLTHGGKRLEIVHRDVSPSNIMLLRAGGVKLLDFGIAKAAMEIRSDAHTQTGLVKGKLSYVAPEQIKGHSVDGRSDVFALGVVLWESLTGKRLFFDRNDFQTMKNVVERPVPPPSMQVAEVPQALDYIVLRALERDPEKRYPDARAMADEIETVLQEARFVPGTMVRLLDDLFGPEDHDADVISTPSSPVPRPADSSLITLPERNDGVPVGLMPPLPIIADEEESYAGVSSVRRAITLPPRRRSMAWAGAAVAAAAVAIVSGTLAMRGGSTAPRGSAVGPVSPPSAVLPVEAPRPAPSKTVTVKIDSDPQGAEVRDAGGALLGQTPTVLTMPRSGKAVALTLQKPGFSARTQPIVPDRDVSAVVSLVPQPPEPPKARPAPRKKRVERRIREGLSVDPFADP